MKNEHILAAVAIVVFLISAGFFWKFLDTNVIKVECSATGGSVSGTTIKDTVVSNNAGSGIVIGGGDATATCNSNVIKQNFIKLIIPLSISIISISLLINLAVNFLLFKSDKPL